MHFDEREAGDFKIYTGAIEVPSRGYRAALVIKRVRGREVYRDEDLAAGFAWPDAREALAYAMRVGQKVVADGRLALRS